MSRNNFNTLLDKYLAGKCSADEKQLVEHWYALLDNPDLDNPQDIEVLKNKIWGKIQNDMSPVAAEWIPAKKSFSFWQRPVFKYAMAASLV